MSLNELQKEIAAAVAKRFPNEYTPIERFVAITAQIGELGDLLLIREGVKENHKNQHNSCEEALVNAFIDSFLLSEQLHINLDEKIRDTLSWFEEVYKSEQI